MEVEWIVLFLFISVLFGLLWIINRALDRLIEVVEHIERMMEIEQRGQGQ